MKNTIKLILIAVLALNSVNAISNDSIQALIKNCKVDTQKVNHYLEVARYYEFEDPEMSADYVNKALSLSKKINYKAGEADSYVFYGLLMEDEADYEKAIEYFHKALDIFIKEDIKKGIGGTYNNLGSLHEYLGEYDTAIVYLEKAVKVNDDCGNELSAADARYNIGLVYMAKGNYDMALTNWFKVLDVYEKLKDYEGLSATQHVIGMTLTKQDKDNKALEFLKMAKENGLKTNDSRIVGNIVMSTGNVYLENQVLDTAMSYFKEAKLIYEETGDQNGLASIETNIGDCYKYSDRLDSAIFYYKSSYEKFHEIGEFQGETHTLAELAECYKMIGDYTTALEYCDMALNNAKKIEAKNYQSMIYKIMYMIYNKKEDYKKALEYHILYTEMKDSIFSESKQEIIEELQTRYETEKKEQKIILQQSDIDKQAAIITKERFLKYGFLAIGLLLLGLAIVIYRSLRHKKKANALLAAQKEEIQTQRDLAASQRDLIAEQKQELTDSIHYAYRIQSAVIPDPEYISALLPEYFIFYRPRNIVSGDFYWIGEKNDKLIIIAADCTGHGVPGAFMSMMGVAFLNDIINKEDVSSPADILNKLRDNIVKAMKQSGKEGEQRDGMDVAAIAIDPKNNKMEFAGANNPLYLIRNNELIEYKGDKMPVSIHKNMTAFSNIEHKLTKGDNIYIFSDGFADQFGGPNNKKFKYKPFKELLLENSDKPMTEQERILETTFESWKGNLDQIDDIIIIGIRI